MNNLEYLERSFYEKTGETGGTLYVIEQEKSGEARLTLHCSNEAVVFSIKPNRGFPYLRTKNTPDGIVFVKREEQRWELHIFECKKTVGEDSWEKAKRQFEGGILHAYMLRGLLDLPPFSKICVYTAYRDDHLSKNSPDPALFRQPVGKPVKKPPYADWDDPSLVILGHEVPHQRIPLNDSGQGEYTL
ncbi:hypothetical protein GT3570_16270 [Geobacillus thermoleovorans]|uniref:hypothetical protein n=1 Tax=Geobacillus thermoleovorans TaxID=33941 RepID=UPI00078B1BE0|nr:hypothetical protein GT3570_16270 [Geobacillus thermoleovorans]